MIAAALSGLTPSSNMDTATPTTTTAAAAAATTGKSCDSSSNIGSYNRNNNNNAKQRHNDYDYEYVNSIQPNKQHQQQQRGFKETTRTTTITRPTTLRFVGQREQEKQRQLNLPALVASSSKPSKRDPIGPGGEHPPPLNNREELLLVDKVNKISCKSNQNHINTNNRNLERNLSNDCLFIGGKPVSNFLIGKSDTSQTRNQRNNSLSRAINDKININRDSNRPNNDKCDSLIQQLPNSIALSALNYLSNFRDSNQPNLSEFGNSSRQVRKLSSPKLSPTISCTSRLLDNDQKNDDRNHKNDQRISTLNLLKPAVSSILSSRSTNSNVALKQTDHDSNDDRYQFAFAIGNKTKSQLIYKEGAEEEEQQQHKTSKLQGFKQEDSKMRENNKSTSGVIEDDSTPRTLKSSIKSPSSSPACKKSNRFCLALVTLFVISIIASCQVKLTIGQQQQQQQQQPRSQHQPHHAQLSPTSQGGPIGTAGNGPPAMIPTSGRQANVGPQPVAGSLVAQVNCNKIRGHVTLTPNQQGSVTVSTQINEGPPGEVYQWSVHQFPVKPGAAMCTCSPLILGSKLIDFGEMHGNLPSNQEYSVQSSTLALFGPDSPVGHSLLLRGIKTGVVACATFLPTSRKSNYRAKFHEPLSGSVTIFQTAFGSSFLSHLMYSNGTRRHSVHRFDLVKKDDDLMLLNPGNRPLTASPSNSNSLMIEQREHENEISQCRRFASGEPLLRNMTYQLSVSTENFGMRSRTALVLPQIPFETFSSVYVIVYSEHNPLEPIACAPLKFVRPKTASAKFQTSSVQGNVVFSQDSPYDPTQARINLQLPNSDGHSYGIDELPMIIRRKSDTRVCPNIREIIYNPHHIEPSSVPGEGEATSDQYAVGDLSGKYGSLAGKSSERIQVSDFNLPLFGPNSIVGRAMTIYSAEGVAIACSNVELNTPMTTAFATFDFGIQGQFIFRQAQNDCNGDTYVYIEVSRPMQQQQQQAASSADNQARTLDHNWHVHVNPIDSGLDHLSTTECSAAGPHFNPYNTSTANIYSRDCTPFNVLRCELGDLASKMFTLEIPPYRVKSGQEPDIGKFFGTDIDLPLCGPVSIVNRSVVVHGPDFGMHRLACSTVIEFKPRSSA